MELNTTQMLAEKSDGIGWVTFNNPERRNAITIEMQKALPVIMASFAADPEVRVVVLKGAGDKAFVSGADISEFDKRRASPEAMEETGAIGRRSNESYAALGKPIIAMIRGFCLGGGLLTALRADLRVASEDSQFGIPAVRLGVGYGWENVKAVVDVMGATHAREMLVTGDRFDAQTALRWGLINRVVPGDDLENEVRRLARTIASNAPLTVKTIRAAIDEGLKDPESRDLAMVQTLANAANNSQDFLEGRHAFLEKRRPAFSGQ